MHRPAFATGDFAAYAMGWFVRPGWEFEIPTALTIAAEPLLQQYDWQVAAAITALLLMSLAWSIALLRRSRRGSGRPPRRRMIIFAGMLLLDIGVLALIWLYLPRAFDTTTVGLARSDPDIGILLVAATVLAVAWGVARTVLAGRALIRRKR